MSHTELFEMVTSLQNGLVAHATDGGGSFSDEEYSELRTALMSEREFANLVPTFVRTCRSLSQFWSFIKHKEASYQGRRLYIWGEFEPLLERLEAHTTSPIDSAMFNVTSDTNSAHVADLWQKIMDTRDSDPEGAITKARSLVESVCKVILDDAGVAYSMRDDLPKLYKLAATQLNLAPDQHSEEAFKVILGGCQTVIGGLAEIRNKLGDAHGKGSMPAKPGPRHAELAVNLAGAMTTFLIKTWESKKTARHQ